MIIILATIVFGAIIYFFIGSDNKFETESWEESYSPKDKGPYGTYVFKELLDTNGIFETFIHIDGQIENQLIDNEDENDIYFFIGDVNYMSENSFDKLLDFVSKGNTAFISARQMPDYLLDYFFLDLNDVYDYERDSVQKYALLSDPFYSKEYSFTFIKNNKATYRDWAYFSDDNIIHQNTAPITIGTNADGQINFVEIAYGGGTFFFHTNPYQFTNISFFRFDGFNYAEDLIHHLPYGKIQWDIYNLGYHYVSGDSDSGDSNQSTGNERSIFQFIFQHPPLIWAFAILCIAALLFAIFQGKRRQNIVSAIELKENSSLSYIETVSSLYLQERKHNKLVRLQKRCFIDFIGNHYYIRSQIIDDKYINSVSVKSGIESEKITAIFSELETLANQTEVTDMELIGIQQKIEHFYKTCK
ncbi:MAG: DUF4350 domain-containing protein [Crocinitomicaceae bacterium]